MKVSQLSYVLALSAGLGLAPIGCSKKQEVTNDNTEVQDLNEIFNLYNVYIKQKRHLPKQLSNLTTREYDVPYPGAVQKLTNGDYLILYGVDPAGLEGDIPLAYPRSVPTEGGSVLLASGKIKQMAPDEFRAAAAKYLKKG